MTINTQLLRDLAVRSSDGDLRGAALYAADTIDTQAAEIARLRSEFDRANDSLAAIGDFAHSKSTGPATPDALWEVRAMAYDAVRIPEDIDDTHTGDQP
jgi:hypothetical protein